MHWFKSIQDYNELKKIAYSIEFLEDMKVNRKNLTLIFIIINHYSSNFKLIRIDFFTLILFIQLN